eukprot:10358361-Alexandrium_andersonii.AAC.1
MTEDSAIAERRLADFEPAIPRCLRLRASSMPVFVDRFGICAKERCSQSSVAGGCRHCSVCSNAPKG